MKLIAGLLLVACVCVSIAVATNDLHTLSSLTIPVFMWSNKNVFSSSEVVDTVRGNELEQTLLSLFNTDNQQSKLLNSDVSQTEVVVLFVEPELRTDLLPQIKSSLSNLKNQMDSSASSLVIPYALINGFSLLDTTLSRISDTQAEILVVREGESSLFSTLRKLNGVNTVALNEFSVQKFAETNKNIFSNGKTDLIVVSFEQKEDGSSFASHDAAIEAITSEISAFTNGDFVALYTANAPAPLNMKWSFGSENVLSSPARYVVLTDENNGNGSFVPPYYSNHINYFPSVILESFIILAILLAMVFTGVCAIFSLQTPDRWEMPKIKRE